MNVLDKLNAAASSTPKSSDVVLTEEEYAELFDFSVAEVGSDLVVAKAGVVQPRSRLFGSKDSGSTFSGVRIHVENAKEPVDAEETA